MKRIVVAVLLFALACFNATPSYAAQWSHEEILAKHQESLLVMSVIADQLEKVKSVKAKTLKALEYREQYATLFGPDIFEVNVKLAEALHYTSALEQKAQKSYQKAVDLAAHFSFLKGISFSLQGMEYLKGKSVNEGRTYLLTDQELAQIGVYSQEALKALEQAVELDPKNQGYRDELEKERQFWDQFKKGESVRVEQTQG